MASPCVPLCPLCSCQLLQEHETAVVFGARQSSSRSSHSRRCRRACSERQHRADARDPGRKDPEHLVRVCRILIRPLPHHRVRVEQVEHVERRQQLRASDDRERPVDPEVHGREVRKAHAADRVEQDGYRWRPVRTRGDVDGLRKGVSLPHVGRRGHVDVEWQPIGSIQLRDPLGVDGNPGEVGSPAAAEF